MLAKEYFVGSETTLLDGTIAENIAFGVSNPNVETGKIEEILEMVELRNFVEALPDGLVVKLKMAHCYLVASVKDWVHVDYTERVICLFSTRLQVL